MWILSQQQIRKRPSAVYSLYIQQSIATADCMKRFTAFAAISLPIKECMCLYAYCANSPEQCDIPFPCLTYKPCCAYDGCCCVVLVAGGTAVLVRGPTIRSSSRRPLFPKVNAQAGKEIHGGCAVEVCKSACGLRRGFVASDSCCCCCCCCLPRSEELK